MTNQTAEIKRPVPTPDEASEPFFQGTVNHQLMLMRCRACGAYRYPSRDRCDSCWSTDTEWAQATGRGTVYSFSIMHQLYNPAFKDAIPYNVALVELEEGVRMTTNIVDCANEAIRVGMPVEVVFEDVAENAAIPRFRPRG